MHFRSDEDRTDCTDGVMRNLDDYCSTRLSLHLRKALLHQGSPDQHCTIV